MRMRSLVDDLKAKVSTVIQGIYYFMMVGKVPLQGIFC